MRNDLPILKALILSDYRCSSCLPNTGDGQTAQPYPSIPHTRVDVHQTLICVTLEETSSNSESFTLSSIHNLIRGTGEVSSLLTKCRYGTR